MTKMSSLTCGYLVKVHIQAQCKRSHQETHCRSQRSHRTNNPCEDDGCETKPIRIRMIPKLSAPFQAVVLTSEISGYKFQCSYNQNNLSQTDVCCHYGNMVVLHRASSSHVLYLL